MAELGEKWKAWVERFWWLRGAAAAIAVAGTVPSFLDLKSYQFLRMFHALIVGWNKLAEQIGAWIGELVSVPPISATIVNIAIFFFSVGVPAAVAHWGAAKKAREEANEVLKKANERQQQISEIICQWAVKKNDYISQIKKFRNTLDLYKAETQKSSVKGIGDPRKIEQNIQNLEQEYSSVDSDLDSMQKYIIKTQRNVRILRFIFYRRGSIAVLIACLAPYYYWSLNNTWLKLQEPKISLVYLLLLLSFASCAFGIAYAIYFACKKLKGFRRGVVYVFSFLVIMEAMYLLNVGGGALNEWACETLEIPDDEC